MSQTIKTTTFAGTATNFGQGIGDSWSDLWALATGGADGEARLSGVNTCLLQYVGNNTNQIAVTRPSSESVPWMRAELLFTAGAGGYGPIVGLRGTVSGNQVTTTYCAYVYDNVLYIDNTITASHIPGSPACVITAGQDYLIQFDAKPNGTTTDLVARVFAASDLVTPVATFTVNGESTAATQHTAGSLVAWFSGTKGGGVVTPLKRFTSYNVADPLVAGTISLVSSSLASVNLSVTDATGGVSPLTKQWYRDGVVLTGQTGSTLTDSPEDSSTHLYKVRFTDAVGGSVDSGTFGASHQAIPTNHDAVVYYYGRTGLSLFATIEKTPTSVWNPESVAFEAPSSDNWEELLIPMDEIPGTPGVYAILLSGRGIPVGWLTVTVYSSGSGYGSQFWAKAPPAYWDGGQWIGASPPSPPPAPVPSVYELKAPQVSPKVGKWYLGVNSVRLLRLNLANILKNTNEQVTGVTSLTGTPTPPALTVEGFAGQYVDFWFTAPAGATTYSLTVVVTTNGPQTLTFFADVVVFAS